jgi:hypothetical protein
MTNNWTVTDIAERFTQLKPRSTGFKSIVEEKILRLFRFARLLNLLRAATAQNLWKWWMLPNATAKQ